MNVIKKIAVILFTGLFIVGCSSRQEKLVKFVKPGMTPEEVQKYAGEPREIITLTKIGNKTTIYTWFYGETDSIVDLELSVSFVDDTVAHIVLDLQGQQELIKLYWEAEKAGFTLKQIKQVIRNKEKD